MKKKEIHCNNCEMELSSNGKHLKIVGIGRSKWYCNHCKEIFRKVTKEEIRGELAEETIKYAKENQVNADEYLEELIK